MKWYIVHDRPTVAEGAALIRDRRDLVVIKRNSSANRELVDLFNLSAFLSFWIAFQVGIPREARRETQLNGPQNRVPSDRHRLKRTSRSPLVCLGDSSGQIACDDLSYQRKRLSLGRGH